MKWFKHMSDATNDPKLIALFDEFGFEGLGMWWVLVETVASNWDGKGEPSLELSAKGWRKLTGIYPKTFRKLLTFLEKAQLIRATFLEKGIKVQINKLKEIKDNHTSNLQAADKSSRARIPEAEAEEEKDRGVGAHAPARVREERPRPPQSPPLYSAEFIEFMDWYGEEPNDGAWAAWCAVCGRQDFKRSFVQDRLHQWQESRQWARGAQPSAANFLRNGYWQRTPPKEPQCGAAVGEEANRLFGRVISLIKEGRYDADLSAELGQDAAACVHLVGGLRTIGDADQFELGQLRKRFMNEYTARLN